MRRSWARLSAAAVEQRVLIQNAGFLVGASVATSVLGVVFWWVAARWFPQESVGVAGASVSAMTMLGFTGMLGLGTLLMGELPKRQAPPHPLINAALAVAGLTGAALGLLFLLPSQLISANFAALTASWWVATLFVLGVGLAAMLPVLDQALIGLLRGGLQFRRLPSFRGKQTGHPVLACGAERRSWADGDLRSMGPRGIRFLGSARALLQGSRRGFVAPGVFSAPRAARVRHGPSRV